MYFQMILKQHQASKLSLANIKQVKKNLILCLQEDLKLKFYHLY